MAVRSLGESVETVEVDLFDRKYTLKPITRSVEAQLDAIDKANQDKYDKDTDFADIPADEFVEIFAEIADAILKPADGGRTAASKAIKDAWAADKLERFALAEFLTSLRRGESAGEESAGPS